MHTHRNADNCFSTWIHGAIGSSQLWESAMSKIRFILFSLRYFQSFLFLFLLKPSLSFLSSFIFFYFFYATLLKSPLSHFLLLILLSLWGHSTPTQDERIREGMYPWDLILGSPSIIAHKTFIRGWWENNIARDCEIINATAPVCISRVISSTS